MTTNGSGGPPVIELAGVGTRLGGKVIHEDIDLEVARGEVLALVGGSGSGKTTLLRLMLGLMAPQAGEVRVLGHALGACARRDLALVQHRRGVLFQGGALFSALPVFANVALPLRERGGLPKAAVREMVMFALSAVGIGAEHANKMPAELSGGMVKRVALARALVLGPSLLFLDEPTAGLDPIGAAAFDDLILNLQQSLGLTVFMVTHDLDSLHAICDRIAVLVDKRVKVGTVADHLKDDHPWIREYFHGPRARAAQVA